MNAAADALVHTIQTGFAGGTYPGDAFLQGSFDGCEPYDEVAPFIPAYLVADVRGQLATADPAFHLTHCLTDAEQRGKRSALLNPRRYGAMTWYDYARYRLSVFAREEASSILAYLTWKGDQSEFPQERRTIDAALETFWRDRAATAPPAAALGPGQSH
jgi:hypothetical protein